MGGCARRMTPSLPKSPEMSYGKISRVEARRARASKRFRRKENRKANRQARKLTRNLKQIERIAQTFRKEHFKRQSPETQQMMINSALESELLRKRGNFWPYLQRNWERKKMEEELWTNRDQR